MTDSERTLDELAAQPIDAVDLATLDRLRAAADVSDPVPGDLVSRVHFAVALDEMFEEVAAISRLEVDSVAIRAEQAGTRTETLTFSAESLTAMVTVTRMGQGRLRLDGWLAPPSPLHISLREVDGPTRETIADAGGRFSFADLDEGLGQLRFFAEGDTDSAVVTPVFEL